MGLAVQPVLLLLARNAPNGQVLPFAPHAQRMEHCLAVAIGTLDHSTMLYVADAAGGVPPLGVYGIQPINDLAAGPCTGGSHAITNAAIRRRRRHQFAFCTRSCDLSKGITAYRHFAILECSWTMRLSHTPGGPYCKRRLYWAGSKQTQQCSSAIDLAAIATDVSGSTVAEPTHNYPSHTDPTPTNFQQVAIQTVSILHC